MKRAPLPRPVDRLAGRTGYAPPRPDCPIDLKLDGNEGPAPDRRLLHAFVREGQEAIRRYPDARPLEADLAARLGLAPDGVLVTAGADEALDRLCRAYLEPGRSLVVATPTFEMIPRYAALAGARLIEAPWPDGPYPVDAVLDRLEADTAMIVVVSPNNPTGAVATAEDLARLSQAAPGALLVVDLAYGDFADVDLMPTVLRLPNAVAVRSLSKAWGLAGLRVGYAAGSPELLRPLRAAGGPYAVSGPSLVMAAEALADPEAVASRASRIASEREGLFAVLTEVGARPSASQGNFVYAAPSDAVWLRDGLAGLGIAVRLFAGSSPGDGRVRVSCPGDAADLERLIRGVRTVSSPEALLLDMDGVIADVSGSYRRAIVETARGFGVVVDADDVARAKRSPGSNNDWVLTRNLLVERGVSADLDDVTARFQAVYSGLVDRETAIVPRAVLARLAARLPLGVVTGRPREEALTFLRAHGLEDLFAALVCLEDGPSKPDPAPVRLALERLGVARAWMVGDTVDDMLAARAAGVVPLGVTAPGDDPSEAGPALTAAGAGRVLASLSELEDLLS